MQARAHSAWRSAASAGDSQWRCLSPLRLHHCASAKVAARHCCIFTNGSLVYKAALVVTSVLRHAGCAGTDAGTPAMPSAVQLQSRNGASTPASVPSHQDAHPPHQRNQRQEQQRAVLLEGRASTNGALPEVLQSTFPEAFPTPTSARRACRMRRVLVDGVLSKCDTQVAAGHLLQQLDALQPRVKAGGLLLQVLYEDEHMAVVIKPFGVPMHGRGTRTVNHNLAGNLQPSTAESAMPRPHPAHRLDTATGGLLICSKTRNAAAALTAAFEHRHIHKRYRAILAGRLTPMEGSISTPVNGRQAHTRYQVVEHSRALKFGGWITTVDLFPATGRTHQLRMHCASLGHPILGDAKYTLEGADRLAGQGMCLWAAALRLAHPATGQTLSIEAPEPSRFQKVRANEAARWARFCAGEDGVELLQVT